MQTIYSRTHLSKHVARKNALQHLRVVGGRSRGASAARPVRVGHVVARAVDALVGVGTEVIALRLDEIGGRSGGPGGRQEVSAACEELPKKSDEPVAVVERQSGGEAGSGDA